MAQMGRFQTDWVSRQEAVLLLGLGLGTYTALSIVWTSGDQWYAGTYLATLIAAFLIGRIVENRTITTIWIGFLILTLCVSPWVTNNYLGAAYALIFAAGIAYDFIILIFIGLFGAILSHSRAALIAIGITAFLGIWRYNWKLALLALTVCIGFVLILKNDFDNGFLARIGIWQDTINHMSPWGHGFGSFQTEYAHFHIRTNMTTAFAPHAYNDFLELIFELGLGAVAIGPFLGLCLTGAPWAERLIFVTFAILGLTFFPFYVPVIGNMAMLTLGAASRERYV